MKKFFILLVILIIIILVFLPIKLLIEGLLIRSDLKKAFMQYAEDYCNLNIKIQKVESDLFYSPVSYYRNWSIAYMIDYHSDETIRTNAEILRVSGEIFDEYVTFSGMSKCTGQENIGEDGSYILDRTKNIFIKHEGILPSPTTPVGLYVFIYYILIISSPIILFLFLYRRKR